jgi:mannose-6-phosphate isomerase
MLYRAEPMQVPRVWGSLRSGTGERIGELWWVYDGSSGSTPLYPVTGGKACTLSDLAADGDPSVNGSFPLLVKTLHTADRLSVQVHPGSGGTSPSKEETWVILEADRGAWMMGGLLPSADPTALADAARTGTLPGLLGKHLLRQGDVIHIPPGTIHSLGPGLTVLEIQENCDVTYRLYDWGRPGLDGRPRRLDLEEGTVSVSSGSVPLFLRREECCDGIPGPVSYSLQWLRGPLEVDLPPLSVFFLDRGTADAGSVLEASSCILSDREGGRLLLDGGSSGWMTGVR